MYSLNPIPTEPYSERIISARHPYVKNLAPETDVTSGNLTGCPPILQIDKASDDFLGVCILANVKPEVILLEYLWRVEAVDRGDGSYRDDIRPRNQRGYCREPLLFDAFVHLELLVNVQVSTGDVSLWLVVVVVADEVLNRVFREKP